MHGSAIINAKNELDVSYNTPYVAELRDFVSNALITTHNSFSSSAQIKLIDELFSNTAIISAVEQLRGTASVNENLSLDVILGILQSPKIEINVEAVQDAYTRQSRPYNNFGYLLSLAVGKAAEGEFISYVDFDLTNIKNLNQSDIWAINLKLSPTSSVIGVVDVYENRSSWSEGFVMWVSQMNLSDEPIFSFNSSELSIDITDLIKDKISKGETTFKIALKSNDFLMLNSKESGHGPTLSVICFKPNWNGNIGSSSLASSAVIVASTRKLFHSSVSIGEKYHKRGTAILREKGLHNSEATIVSPILHGNANVLANWSTPPASAMIMRHSDLVSKYDKNAIETNNSATLLTRNLFPSFVQIPSGEWIDWKSHEATIRANGTSLNSEAIIAYNDFMPNNAFIKEYNLLHDIAGIVNPNFPSSATINAVDDFDSEANIVVPYYEGINSEVLVKYYKDNPDSVLIINNNDTDISASVIIKDSSKLGSEVSIYRHTNLVGEAILSVHDSEDLSANAMLNELYNLPNEAIIHQHKDLYSDSTVRVSDLKDTLANAIIKNIGVHHMNGEAVLHQNKDSELVSDALLRVHESTYLPDSAIIRNLADSDLNNEVTIHQHTNLTGDALLRALNQKDLGSSVLINNSLDIASEAYLHQFDNEYLENKAILRVNTFKNIWASAIVRNYGLHRFDNEATIHQHNNLVSDAIVRVSDINDRPDNAIFRNYGLNDLYTESIVYRKETFSWNNEAIIRVSSINNLLANAIVRNYGMSNLTAEADIYQNTNLFSEFILRVNDLKNQWANAIILVHDTNESGGESYLNAVSWKSNEAVIHKVSDLIARTKIIVPVDHDLQSIVDIFRTSYISAEAKIHRISEIFDTVIIRESEVRLHHSTAYLHGWYPFDTPAYVDILGSGKSIHGIATIRTNARLVIPTPVEGKLPREWKWEDYFPPA